jgi:soluble lytic murein transglycosylase-like protein
MTNGLRATLAEPVGHEFLVEAVRSRAVVFAVVATLSLALLSTAVARFSGWSAAAAVPAILPAKATVDIIAPGAARHLFAPAARDQIDALGALVSKRYRVSPKAARELIGTAYREAGRSGVDPLLIVAVICVESRFNPIAQSDAGATGLMQIIPGFHKDKLDSSIADPVSDPHANIRLGALILQEYIKRAGGEAAGLQLYNGSSDDATNAYANKVFAERQRLQQAIARPRDRVRV